jgi:hypothetical protein
VRSDCQLVQGGQSYCFTKCPLHCPLTAALFGQLLPQQGGAIQFRMLPSVPEISSGIYHLPCFGRLACCLNPALSLCAFPDLCWVLVAPLGGWLVTALPLSAFMPFSISAWCMWLLWKVGLLPQPCYQHLLLYHVSH